MFERYNEQARRAVFFARYEASQFGSAYIESEHLLLGLLREDKALANLILKSRDAIDSLRAEVEGRMRAGAGTSTSVDMPLSHECKRVLAYGAEESERLNHKHIGSIHLLLGLLRESKCVGAAMLTARGVRLEEVREHAAKSQPAARRVLVREADRFEPPPLLLSLLAHREQSGGITVAVRDMVGGHTVDVAIYEGEDVVSDGDPLHQRSPEGEPSSPRRRLADLRATLRDSIRRMERAIENHEFEKARFFSDQERLLRNEIRMLRESMGEAPGLPASAPVPFLCILMAGEESLFTLRVRIGGLLEEGVAHVWVLETAGPRVYTATAGEGLREFTEDLLRVDHPPVELDWKPVLGVDV